MNRHAAIILAGLALAGCAAPRQAAPLPQPPRTPGGPVIPAAPPPGEPEGFAGLPAAQLRVRFGAPVLVRRDGPTEMWRYDGTACRVFFFLSGTGGAQTVRHVETLPRGARSAADPACLTALQPSPARAS